MHVRQEPIQNRDAPAPWPSTLTWHAFLHRLRAEIFLKRDPADTAPAEEAFLRAIAIAQQQKARSFGLLAAVGLAQLYNSMSRSADAQALLTSALEGFIPTAEFSELEEAQALLLMLAS